MEQQLFVPIPISLPPSSSVALPHSSPPAAVRFFCFQESQATQPLQQPKNASPGRRASVTFKQGFILFFFSSKLPNKRANINHKSGKKFVLISVSAIPALKNRAFSETFFLVIELGHNSQKTNLGRYEVYDTYPWLNLQPSLVLPTFSWFQSEFYLVLKQMILFTWALLNISQ